MGKKIITIMMLFLVASLSIFYTGCTKEEEPYNLIITNNSDEEFKSIGYYEKNQSGGVTNADNSLIKPGQEVRMNMEENKFKLSTINKNDEESISEEFNLNFKEKSDKIYKISIEKNSSGENKFIVKD